MLAKVNISLTGLGEDPGLHATSPVKSARKANFGFTRGNALARAMGGHLASIEDREEDAFLFDLISVAPELSEPRLYGQAQIAEESWPILIGLHRLVEPSGRISEWVWTTGDVASYSNWARGEAQSNTVNEFVAAYFPRWANREQRRVEWRSTSGSTNRFVIEIE